MASLGAATTGVAEPAVHQVGALEASTAPQPASVAAPPPTPGAGAAAVAAVAKSGTIKWTVGRVFASLGIFILAGLAEIGGGWLVWQTIRNNKPWYYVVGGSCVLVAYGFIPTLQPEGASFSRVYAVYGGVFIVLSYLWGWALDGDKPDTGDFIGAAIALAGVAVAWFWPRG